MPVNYRSLTITDTGIEYVDLLRETTCIPYDAMVRVEFVREEAMFPDIFGPYLETKWIIHTIHFSLEVMDEAPHREALCAAFARYLPPFDSAAAQSGLGARQEGRWLCFQR